MFAVLLPLADFVVCVLFEDSVIAVSYAGLQDLPYCMGDPVFHLPSPASRKELAARETKSPVLD